ncbi:MAG: hypothetical protein V1678_02665 [Candidatus Aenigmatarchaeota archaeon]
MDDFDVCTGDFSGTGVQTGNSENTWTVEGNVEVDGITFVLKTNVGSAYPGYELDATGTIASNGETISGSGNDNYFRTTPWEASGVTAKKADCDKDSVPNENDLCLETQADSKANMPGLSLGTNRWVWNVDSWKTTPPKGKTTPPDWDPKFKPTMTYTYGCSCKQILDRMSETTGFDFGGHYKYGCSKSILQDWNRGTYYVGPTFVETVVVPANDADGVESLMTLDLGKDYFLKAYGTAFACNQPGCVINFDAEYSTSDLGLTWVDGVAAPYDSYGLDLLDLKVDGAFVNWGAYNSTHVYTIPKTGTGNVLFVVNDLAGSYFNNDGILSIDIIEDKWVNLW